MKKIITSLLLLAMVSSVALGMHRRGGRNRRNRGGRGLHQPVSQQPPVPQNIGGIQINVNAENMEEELRRVAQQLRQKETNDRRRQQQVQAVRKNALINKFSPAVTASAVIISKSFVLSIGQRAEPGNPSVVTLHEWFEMMGGKKLFKSLPKALELLADPDDDEDEEALEEIITIAQLVMKRLFKRGKNAPFRQISRSFNLGRRYIDMEKYIEVVEEEFKQVNKAYRKILEKKGISVSQPTVPLNVSGNRQTSPSRGRQSNVNLTGPVNVTMRGQVPLVGRNVTMQARINPSGNGGVNVDGGEIIIEDDSEEEGDEYMSEDLSDLINKAFEACDLQDVSDEAKVNAYLHWDQDPERDEEDEFATYVATVMTEPGTDNIPQIVLYMNDRFANPPTKKKTQNSFQKGWNSFVNFFTFKQ